MSKAELQKLCDPANYLGQAGEMVDRVLALRQAVAESHALETPPWTRRV